MLANLIHVSLKLQILHTMVYLEFNIINLIDFPNLFDHTELYTFNSIGAMLLLKGMGVSNIFLLKITMTLI